MKDLFVNKYSRPTKMRESSARMKTSRKPTVVQRKIDGTKKKRKMILSRRLVDFPDRRCRFSKSIKLKVAIAMDKTLTAR